jgi:hypothetical protein
LNDLLYILLGVLVAGAIAMQVWMARSQATMAGDRAALLSGIRIFNIVLVLAATGIVAYAVFWPR